MNDGANKKTENRIILDLDHPAELISRHIYGQFAEHLGRCIYEGIWVGEDSPIPNIRGIRKDVVEALRRLRIPNLRWPGGCFADTYHWKDGIGPRQNRPGIINIHWGDVLEHNHFGTHEFMDLCELLGCEPYICGNVGSGTVREMAEWLEYLTMAGDSPLARLRRENGRDEPWSLRFWGVGNENWGCGGNMRAQYYADVYRRYASYCRNFGGKPLYRIACGFNDEWNEILMRDASRFFEGLSIHYYTVIGSDGKKGSSTEFTEEEWARTMAKACEIEKLILSTRAIMDRFDPEKRVGLVVDEWGTCFDVEPGTNPLFLYQQNTMRDALVAALTLNIFHHHADRVKIANIAQMVNVLQAMILTRGAEMVLTPTYHVFEMYRVHQDARRLPLHLESLPYHLDHVTLPQVSASASCNYEGVTHLSLCNLDHRNEAPVRCFLRGGNLCTVHARILTGPAMNACNDFGREPQVVPRDFTELAVGSSSMSMVLPPYSVVTVSMR
ncbi:MAG: alpha-N-arabinofuranosidase [Lentisphaerae bacterium]|nr:MAG: alpha-N-arabinofuranosidase [Lentisphaerota bacterium]